MQRRCRADGERDSDGGACVLLGERRRRYEFAGGPVELRGGRVTRPDGTLIGYIGIQEALTPARWHLPEQKVVRLHPKKVS